MSLSPPLLCFVVSVPQCALKFRGHNGRSLLTEKDCVKSHQNQHVCVSLPLSLTSHSQKFYFYKARRQKLGRPPRVKNINSSRLRANRQSSFVRRSTWFPQSPLLCHVLQHSLPNTTAVFPLICHPPPPSFAAERYCPLKVAVSQDFLSRDASPVFFSLQNATSTHIS